MAIENMKTTQHNIDFKLARLKRELVQLQQADRGLLNQFLNINKHIHRLKAEVTCEWKNKFCREDYDEEEERFLLYEDTEMFTKDSDTSLDQGEVNQTDENICERVQYETLESRTKDMLKAAMFEGRKMEVARIHVDTQTRERKSSLVTGSSTITVNPTENISVEDESCFGTTTLAIFQNNSQNHGNINYFANVTDSQYLHLVETNMLKRTMFLKDAPNNELMKREQIFPKRFYNSLPKDMYRAGKKKTSLRVRFRLENISEIGEESHVPYDTNNNSIVDNGDEAKTRNTLRSCLKTRESYKKSKAFDESICMEKRCPQKLSSKILPDCSDLNHIENASLLRKVSHKLHSNRLLKHASPLHRSASLRISKKYDWKDEELVSTKEMILEIFRSRTDNCLTKSQSLISLV